MKKIKFLILGLFLFSIKVNCYAQPKLYDRTTLPNYGVNKEIDIESNYNEIMRTNAVDSNDMVYDFLENIPDADEIELRRKLKEFSNKNQMEFIILIDRNFYPDEMKKYCNTQFKESFIKEENEKYIEDFYNYNDFGKNYPNYSGIVLYTNLAPNQCDDTMYYSIYRFGDAKKYITEKNVYDLSKELFPYISKKNYYEGVTSIFEKIEQVKLENISKNKIEEKITTPKEVKVPWSLIIFDFIVSLIIIGIMINKNRMVKKETKAINYIKRGSLKITNKRDKVIL